MLTIEDLYTLLSPETELEERILREPEIVHGMSWGTPRYGHPEGEIWKHVLDILYNIDRLHISPEQRWKLRFIAYIHDTFKYKEHRGTPRDWTKHHSVYARKFAEQFTDDPILLDIIEYHDEAYYIWRLRALYDRVAESDERLEFLLDRIGVQRQLYYLFFKCDTTTGDKNPAPLKWFERYVAGIDVVRFGF